MVECARFVSLSREMDFRIALFAESGCCAREEGASQSLERDPDDAYREVAVGTWNLLGTGPNAPVWRIRMFARIRFELATFGFNEIYQQRSKMPSAKVIERLTTMPLSMAGNAKCD
jgi:hypothetical protein